MKPETALEGLGPQSLAEREGSRWPQMLAALLLGVLLALLVIAARRGWRFAPLGGASAWVLQASYGIAVGAALAIALAPRSWRRSILLATSALVLGLVLRWGAALVAGLTLGVCLIGRSKLRLRWQLTLALALWASLPVCRIALSTQRWVGGTGFLALIWVSLAYAIVYVLVERQRVEVGPSLADELFYFIALPRFIEPFLQPISPKYLRQSERPRMPWRLVWRGFGLGLLGLGLAVLARRYGQGGHKATIEHPVWMTLHFVGFYAAATHQIFLSVALFRLLGFDLASGYRFPFLSRSFGDFFRRYNHYVRDAVLSLFYFPCIGWLRHRVRGRKAIILGSYVAIFVGSFLLNDFLIPVATSVKLGVGLRVALSGSHLIVLALYWSLVILPAAGLVGRPSKHASPLVRTLQVIRFNLVFLLVWYFLGWEHQVRHN